MIKLKITNDSLLLIVKDKQQVKETIERYEQFPFAEERVLSELLDDSDNLGMDIMPNNVIGLTEMLNIAIGVNYEDDDSDVVIGYERLFVYKDTYKKCFYHELLETGQVEFIEV